MAREKNNRVPPVHNGTPVSDTSGAGSSIALALIDEMGQPVSEKPTSISRTFVSDEPVGFEEMAMTAQQRMDTVAVPIVPKLPDPEPEPVRALSERTLAEQAAGREIVSLRAAEIMRNRETTARENAKRMVENSAASAEDLSYNAGATYPRG